MIRLSCTSFDRVSSGNRRRLRWRCVPVPVLRSDPNRSQAPENRGGAPLPAHRATATGNQKPANTLRWFPSASEAPPGTVPPGSPVAGYPAAAFPGAPGPAANREQPARRWHRAPKRAADPQSPPAPPSKNHPMLALTIGVCATAIALGIVLIIMLSTHSSQAGPERQTLIGPYRLANVQRPADQATIRRR